MKNLKVRHVILALPATRISRVDKMRGIFRFISESNTWTIEVVQGELTPRSIESADGIIATRHLSESSKRILERIDVPTVFIAMESARTLNVAHIGSSPREFARRIADYFLDQGLYNSGAILTPSGGARTGFHAACAKELAAIFSRKGLSFTTHTSANELCFDRLPLAVFAVNDDIAAMAIRFCHEKGLRVPQDVAVLGFANDTVFCENHVPSISSVELDFELQGYLAARELDRMMCGRRPRPCREIFVDLKRIVERESTALPQSGKGLVREAIAFIKANATRPIGVAEVVRKLKVSRRLVELRFRERNNCSIHATLLKFRLEATAQELLNSKDSIAEVCERCGWRSENGPKKLFRKAYGMSMRDYRKTEGRRSKEDD